MYKDVSEKIKFYKEQAISRFIDKGIYPTDAMIKEVLDSIDTSLPYFESEEVASGQAFDSEAYNRMFNDIMRDLVLLYKLLYALTVEEYTKLSGFIDSHMENLEERMHFYTNKATQEANTTSLGKTILFKNRNYNIKTNNNLTLIDLGKVTLHPGARIAGLLDADEIEQEKIIFSFYSGDKVLKTTAYNYNYGSVSVPGALNKKEYTYSIDEDCIVSGNIKIDINAKINENNEYKILAGKNKVLVKQFGETGGHYLKDRPTKLNMLGFYERSYIDFYTVGAKSITFRFNKKPTTTNFSLDNYVVSDLNYVHHFFIEADAGFSFDFDLDGGTVYAVEQNGVIIDDELYFPKSINTNDFYVIEYDLSTTINYDAYVEIINDDGEPISINSIMIKELLTLEEGVE